MAPNELRSSLFVACGICTEAAPYCNSHEEYLRVEPCHCVFHKACFLDQLGGLSAEAVGWPCPACAEPMTAHGCHKKTFSKRSLQGKLVTSCSSAWHDFTFPAKAVAPPPAVVVDNEPPEEAAGGVAEIVDETTPSKTPLLQAYVEHPRLGRLNNVHISVTYQHPDDQQCARIEAVVGEDSSPTAPDVLKCIMLVLHVAVVHIAPESPSNASSSATNGEKKKRKGLGASSSAKRPRMKSIQNVVFLFKMKKRQRLQSAIRILTSVRFYSAGSSATNHRGDALNISGSSTTSHRYRRPRGAAAGDDVLFAQRRTHNNAPCNVS